MTYALTTSALRSATRRGVRRDALDLLLLCADREAYVNSGVKILSLSAKKAQRLRKEFGDALISRAERTNVIVDARSGVILSVIKGRWLCSTFRPGNMRHGRGGKRSDTLRGRSY